MWYVIWAESRYEHLLYDNIRKNLDKELYEDVWLPERTEHRKYRGKWRKVRRVLLPGYFFVDTNNAERVFFAIKGYKGFIGILRRDGEFASLSGKEEGILRRLTSPGRSSDISVGRIIDGKIRILDGPLAGMEKYIVSVNKHKRKVKLRLRLFNEERELTMGLILTEDDEM